MDGWDEWMDGMGWDGMDGRIDGTDGWMGGMDGWMDGGMNGWRD